MEVNARDDPAADQSGIEVVRNELVVPGSPEPRWFALYTRSRFEKKLMVELSDRLVEVFLPMREVLRRWKDRKKRLLQTFLPGLLQRPFEKIGAGFGLPQQTLLRQIDDGPLGPRADKRTDGPDHDAAPFAAGVRDFLKLQLTIPQILDKLLHISELSLFFRIRA